MKRLILVLFLQTIYSLGFAQSNFIKKIFLSLPEKDVFDLTRATRDSMLAGKTYYPKDNSDEEIVAYNYGISQEVAEYMYVSMSYETGQRGTAMVEIRNLRMKNNSNLILISKTGGVPGIVYDQQEIIVYMYGADKKLKRVTKQLLPEAKIDLFVKPDIPESIRKKIQKSSSISYDLSHRMIKLSLITESDLKNYLKGDQISFVWKQDNFFRQSIKFE